MMRVASGAPMHNFYEQFAAAALRVPNRPAIEVLRRDRVDTFTYRRLETMAARMAAWLAARGVAPGDRCAILAENDAHWCAAYLGVLRLGAVAVPLDTAYKAYQVARLAADCHPRVIFTSPRHVEMVLEARAAHVEHPFEVVLLHGDHGNLPRAETVFDDDSLPVPPACPAAPGDMGVILYTSGTTSDPKGVVLTHANLLAEREGAFKVVTVTEQDCVLGVLPLFHALAQMANLLLPFSIGARVVFLETLNTTELLRGLAERDVSLFACVPQFFYLIHQRVTHQIERASWPTRKVFQALLATNGALRRFGVNAGPIMFGRVHRVLGRRMRFLITGGSRFDPAIGRDLYRMGFNILQAYGLTETSGAATVMHPGDDSIHSVGPPLPGTEIRILPPDSTDEERVDGEVLIRGPLVMAGYYNRPDATAAALQDGWLHTGDLGRIDAEGRLIITGRKKELIVLSSGKNIYPEEIESHYRQSPFIKELCVLGLTRPGEPSAERLYAVVVPDADVLREKKIVNAGDLMRFEMEGRSVGLPPHKRVLGYDSLDGGAAPDIHGQAETLRDRAAGTRTGRHSCLRRGRADRRRGEVVGGVGGGGADPRGRGAGGARRRPREARGQPRARPGPRLDGTRRAVDRARTALLGQGSRGGGPEDPHRPGTGGRDPRARLRRGAGTARQRVGDAARVGPAGEPAAVGHPRAQGGAGVAALRGESVPRCWRHGSCSASTCAAGSTCLRPGRT